MTQASCHAPGVLSVQRLAWQEACAAREARPDADAGGESEGEDNAVHARLRAWRRAHASYAPSAVHRQTATSPSRAQRRSREQDGMRRL